MGVWACRQTGKPERQIELLRDYVIKHKNERNLHVGEIDMVGRY